MAGDRVQAPPRASVSFPQCAPPRRLPGVTRRMRRLSRVTRVLRRSRQNKPAGTQRESQCPPPPAASRYTPRGDAAASRTLLENVDVHTGRLPESWTLEAFAERHGSR